MSCPPRGTHPDDPNTPATGEVTAELPAHLAMLSEKSVADIYGRITSTQRGGLTGPSPLAVTMQ